MTPAGECYEFKGFAIGAKSQSSKTYIENNINEMENAELDELIQHGLKAIKAGYKEENEDMSGKNIEVYGLDQEKGFHQIDEEVVQTYIDGLGGSRRIEEETP